MCFSQDSASRQRGAGKDGTSQLLESAVAIEILIYSV